MVSLGACVNSVDITGKSALHYAVINNNLEATIILLYELCSPFQKDNSGNRPEDYATERTIKYIMKRIADVFKFFLFSFSYIY